MDVELYTTKPAGFSWPPDPIQVQRADQVAKLEARDRDVRTHEAAHLAAAGSLARSGAGFAYQRGPDGKLYAVGGEVQIDAAPGKTPPETIAKARQIRAAATAPSDPSPQDLAVAARATQMEAEAGHAMTPEPPTPKHIVQRVAHSYQSPARYSAPAVIDVTA